MQDRGDIPAALKELAQLDTDAPIGKAMLGHVLAQRYLGPYSRPTADQLRTWLDRWADLPDAAPIHALLVVRLPRGEKIPPMPAGFVPVEEHINLAFEESEPAGQALHRNPDLDRSVWQAARARGADGVFRLLGKTSGLTPSYAAQLQGEAAQILFTLNRDDEALDLATAGVHPCGPRMSGPCEHAAMPGYIAGLAAWRQGRFEQAGAMFTAAWHAEVTTPSLKAGAAFWAARAQLKARDLSAAVMWLNRASVERRTFYGMLARRALGRPLAVSRVGPGETETLGEADVEAVAATPAGLRAFALLQAEQPERAAAELRSLSAQARQQRSLARALMLVAEAGGLTELAIHYADMLAVADGRTRDVVRFQVPRLRPNGGFRIDPALLYGLARTESDFDATLVSPAGARGLLQIMPETASFIVGPSLRNPARALVEDPGFNLDLGQRYVTYLAGCDGIDGDLIRLLAAYNAGPSNFARWASQIRDNGDPLLFIEAIPIDETRAYVPRVLTYTWIYGGLMHLPAPSLDELAGDDWPRYHPYDDPRGAAAHLH